ncbi:hypothetical protein ABW21_db0207445 [Orbilia brochopaga]|nr:hypothetical protein ABW21_db0207445 [Drechslerella brochopaga]
MQWKISAIAVAAGIFAASTPLVTGHSAIFDAVGDANPSIHGCALGVDDLPAGYLTKFIARNWRDVIAFSKPWNVNKRCTECPKKASEITNQLRINVTEWYIQDYDGPARFPIPGQSGSSVIDGQARLNTKTWTEAFAKQNKIPLVSPGGTVTMQVWQINADGAGPYTCRISYAGSDTQWENKPLQIITNVPGIAGISTESGARHSLVVKLPTDLECSGSYGGKNNICMLQCMNAAPNGPFGACVPIEVKPNAKPPPPPKPYTPPPPPPAKPKEVAKYADGEDLTKEQLDALTGYYKKKKSKKLRFIRD